MTLNALASFAIFITSKKRITKSIATQVMVIVVTGVRYFLSILLINPGKSLSLAMAKGNLDEASTPALAVEIRVIIPTRAIKTPIIGPPIFNDRV